MTEAYKLIEHKYDVVVIGAGGAGLRRLVDGLHHKSVSNPKPYGRRAGWHECGARKHGSGRLALAYV